jgi:N-methylhydantoinase A
MRLLGVDVGGTFTDFYYLEDGRVQVHKVPSTPEDPATAIVKGLAEMNWRPDEVVHGSTVATNTVLERRGARTAFVTTRGFRDLLEIGRQARPDLYDLQPQRPPPLVDRGLRFEVDERLDYLGGTIRDLTAAEAKRVAKEVAAARPETVALCLLFSFANPSHERMLAQALAAEGLDVSASHEVLPEFREYERASTTALNAYVAPVMRRYLARLEERLQNFGSPKLRVIQSSGGIATAAQAAALPGALLLSGPAGGVAGAFATARAAGYERVITFDMGGTSTDVALCPGAVPYTAEWTVSGLPVRLPSVDVHTIGAGGGSIAWKDAGGALRVGPRSAGADPGPASYGKAGPPTVTDANVVLGRLAEGSLLGGGMRLDVDAATAAVGSLGVDAREAARGIVAVANSNIERALRVVSVERGFDPRQFALMAFGGAGPLHACEVAQSLSIPVVIVPRYPGILSAIGMALADATRDTAAPLLILGSDPEAETRTRSAFAVVETRLREEMGGEAEIELALDMRYPGQGYELTIPCREMGLEAAIGLFHEAHQRRYGHSRAGAEVEITLVRGRARLRRRVPKVASLPEGGLSAEHARSASRPLTLDQEVVATVYEREKLLAGNIVRGPAIVAQFDSTTLVPRGWRARVDRQANLILESEH